MFNKRQKVPRVPSTIQMTPFSLRFALERRVFFDGAGLDTAIDGIAAVDIALEYDVELEPAEDYSAWVGGVAEALAIRHEIVFVDPRVNNYQDLTQDLPSGVEVVVLDQERNGVEQITEKLAGKRGLNAIHFLTHGDVGTVQLGATQLDNGNLAEYAKDVQGWGAAV